MPNYSWSLLEQDIPQGWSWERGEDNSIESFIYFIREEGDDGRIKIGVSKNPKKRLGELQVGNPKELYLMGVRRGTYQDEQRIHKLFSSAGIRGEWFEPSFPLLVLITELTE